MSKLKAEEEEEEWGERGGGGDGLRGGVMRVRWRYE